MSDKIPLLLYYHKKNKYSFNALIGALETEGMDEDFDVIFIKNKDILFQILDNIIFNHDLTILCISFFTPQLWDIYGIIKTIKRRYKEGNLKILAGGPHPTGDPVGTLAMGFDITVIGEGEETLIELMKKIQKGQNFEEIKGIGILKDKEQYYYSGKRKEVNLDKYAPFPIKHGKFGPIEITRGCPYQCYYCQTSFLFGKTPRHRSVETICKYVQMMKEKDLTDIRFISPNAFSYGSLDGKSINYKKLEELLVKTREIIGPNGRIFLGSFPSEVRPEHVNEETLSLIKNYASNDNLIIGAQSGSTNILKKCNRGHDIDDIYNAVELTIKKGLKVNVDFIFGLPYEIKEDILLTIEMMRNLSKLGARIHAHSFIPLPMTPFAKKPVGRIDEAIVNEVKDLISRGKAFGDWKKQERIALKVSKYLNKKKIK
ncbi:MAG: TIGR04013 family B12-binding domain/radical SAM domain-containing protein [Promethearchaeota archaeon]